MHLMLQWTFVLLNPITFVKLLMAIDLCAYDNNTSSSCYNCSRILRLAKENVPRDVRIIEPFPFECITTYFHHQRSGYLDLPVCKASIQSIIRCHLSLIAPDGTNCSGKIV